MIRFDPAFDVKNYSDFVLNYEMNVDYDAMRPMGNIGRSHLSNIIHAWLVGLDAEFTPFLQRSLDWIEDGIVRDEIFGRPRDYHRSNLHKAKALGLWMRDGVDYPDIWTKAWEYLKSAKDEKHIYSHGHMKTEYLENAMSLILQAGCYDEGISEFERLWGKKDVNPRKIVTVRDYGYALCQHKLTGCFDEAELQHAGYKVLRRLLLSKWIGRGRDIDAAMLLKIVHWDHDKTLTPLEVIQKAYEDMPGVERPF